MGDLVEAVEERRDLHQGLWGIGGGVGCVFYQYGVDREWVNQMADIQYQLFHMLRACVRQVL